LRGKHFDAEPVDAAASLDAAASGFVVAAFLAIHFRRQSEHQFQLHPVERRQRVSVPAAAAEERRQQWLQLVERQRVRRR
jgi:glycerol kinase